MWYEACMAPRNPAYPRESECDELPLQAKDAALFISHKRPDEVKPYSTRYSCGRHLAALLMMGSVDIQRWALR